VGEALKVFLALYTQKDSMPDPIRNGLLPPLTDLLNRMGNERAKLNLAENELMYKDVDTPLFLKELQPPWTNAIDFLAGSEMPVDRLFTADTALALLSIFCRELQIWENNGGEISTKMLSLLVVMQKIVASSLPLRRRMKRALLPDNMYMPEPIISINSLYLGIALPL